MPSGPGALTKFIELYLLGSLKHVGSHGGDKLFEICGHKGIGREYGDPAIWKTFISPGTYKFIIFDKTSRTIEASSNLPSENDDFIELSKVTNAEHDKIRDAFHEDLPDGEREEAEELHEANAGFSDWISALRIEMPAVYKKWGIFRKDMLFELFEDRIDALELQDNNAKALISQMESSQSAAYKTNRSRPAPQPTDDKNAAHGHLVGNPNSKNPIDDARSFAGRVVSHMAYEDLRKLNIPLGAILDALHDKR